MTLAPLIGAAEPIPLHFLVGLIALVLGAAQLLMPKGTPRHRLMGRIWVAAIVGLAVSGFWINEYRWFGPFGPFHVTSVLILLALWRAVAHARAHRIAAHRRWMIALYWLSVVVSGLLTLLPGRVLHDVFLAGS
jgi:uncharacterized membrane protein